MQKLARDRYTVVGPQAGSSTNPNRERLVSGTEPGSGQGLIRLNPGRLGFSKEGLYDERG
jgi:hypothetical protein